MYKIEKYINSNDFLEIRKELGWKEINKEQVEKAIKNSMINISVFNDKECMCLGRIVGDGILKGMLTDILVKNKYQGKGVGKLVVTTLIKELSNKLNEGDLFIRGFSRMW